MLNFRDLKISETSKFPPSLGGVVPAGWGQYSQRDIVFTRYFLDYVQKQQFTGGFLWLSFPLND